MPETQSGEAIMLRTRLYGEVDKIATFLTRDFGKLTGIAKGAKNSRRRFPNCLEPFARVRVHFRSKPGATLVFMERCDLLKPATQMAVPTRFAYGSYLLELVDKLTQEAHPISEIHDLLGAALDLLESGPATSALLRTFELHLLSDLGYEPQLQACARCDRAFDRAAFGLFDFEHERVLCDGCGGTHHRAADRIALGTLQILAQLQRNELRDSQAMRLDDEVAAEAAGLTGRLLASHLPQPLKSLGLIAALTSPSV